MPATALQHFRDDLARARAIVAHAAPLPHATSAEKLLRTDLIAATASSKSRQPAISLPEWVYEVKFPLRAILEEYENEN